MTEIICRICLTKKNDCDSEWSSLFDKISKETVLQIMKKCANLKILKNDPLPKVICNSCSTNLKFVHTFRNLIVASDIALRKKYLNFVKRKHLSSSDSVVDLEADSKTFNRDSTELESVELKNDLNLEVEVKEEFKTEDKSEVLLEIESLESFRSNENVKLKNELNLLKVDLNNASEELENKIQENNSVNTKSTRSPTLFKLAPNLKKSKHIKRKRQRKKSGNIKSTTTEKQCHERSTVKQENIVNDPIREEDILNDCDITKDEDEELAEFSPIDDFDDQNNDACSREKDESVKKKIHRSHMGRAKCPICNHISINKYVLRQHIRLKHEMNDGKKAYCCDKCPKRYINNYQLKVHQNSHTGAKPYPCDMCDRMFKSPTAARLHKQLQHIADKKWKCFDCQKGFISQHMLQNHVRQVHTKERPFLCEICSKGFSAKGMLTTHIKSVHVKETEPCPVCQKEYNVFSMKVHLQSHQGVKNHICETCGNAFTTKGSLKAHKLIHTGEKPNVCQICGKGFIQKQSLKKHIMSHSDLRPFLCNICNETYKYRQDLLRHMKKHQKELEKH